MFIYVNTCLYFRFFRSIESNLIALLRETVRSKFTKYYENQKKKGFSFRHYIKFYIWGLNVECLIKRVLLHQKYSLINAGSLDIQIDYFCLAF